MFQVRKSLFPLLSNLSCSVLLLESSMKAPSLGPLGLVYAQPASEPPRLQLVAGNHPFYFGLSIGGRHLSLAALFSIHHGGRLRRTFVSHRIHNLAPMPVPRPSPLSGPALEQVTYRGVVKQGVACTSVAGPGLGFSPSVSLSLLGLSHTHSFFFFSPSPPLQKMGMAAGQADQTKRYALLILSHPPHLLQGLAGFTAEFLQQG